MATVTANHKAHRSSLSVSGICTSLADAFIAWNSERATRKALSSLSDRELEDIGLARGDIELIARGVRF